jgi:hypothetical protein
LFPLPWRRERGGEGDCPLKKQPIFDQCPIARDPIKGYIAGQEEHHRTLSFVDELKQLLERNGVEYDPKYFV